MWAGGGHAGGGLSQIDILVALYYHYLKIDPKKPDWEDRDRVVLSKGHGGIGYAPILGDLGYFDEDMLKGTFLLEETQDNLIDVSGADKIEVG